MKKVFGEINLSWKLLILLAVIIGTAVGLLNSVPALSNTSIVDTAVYFDFWILCGIFIIMNSKSNKEAALKSFVFFLISQPIIYLVEVPFKTLGWQLFNYYKPWFIWTVMCLPMGYLGYYLKKDKLWTLIMLVPMLLLLGMDITVHLDHFFFTMPTHLVSYLFCVASLIIYPLFIYKNKVTKYTALAISIIIIVAATTLAVINKPIYETDPLISGDEYYFDDTYKAYLEDASYGDLNIRYEENIESYMVHAKFKKSGTTVLVVEDKKGNKKKYDITILRNTYDIEVKKD